MQIAYRVGKQVKIFWLACDWTDGLLGAEYVMRKVVIYKDTPASKIVLVLVFFLRVSDANFLIASSSHAFSC